MDDLLSIADLSGAEIVGLLDAADALHRRGGGPALRPLLAGRAIGLIFPAGGFRTRATFQLGIQRLGGTVVELPVDLAGRETIEDIAGYLDGWFDGLVVRHADPTRLAALATHSVRPIVNAMTSWEHPCEVLADAQALRLQLGRLDGLKVALVGGATNIIRSWVHLASRLPLQVTQICPPGDEIDAATLTSGQAQTPGSITVTHDLAAGLHDVDVVCTDAWPAATDPATQLARDQRFRPYQVTTAALSRARPNVLLIPCPPVTRGQEVSHEVMASHRHLAYHLKATLLPMHQAIIASLIGGTAEEVPTPLV